MTLEQIADKVIETDVLVVGGGIAGCCTAAKAVEHGLNVTLAEKSKTDRSGSAAQGIDHYSGFLPTGMTPQEFVEIQEKMGPRAFFGGMEYSDPTRLYRTVANRRWAAQELEKLGVPMKWDDGDFHVTDTYYQGGWTCLRVHWQNVKPQLAAAVSKKGVNVLERTMVIDLLTNKGTVVGATAVNTRTGAFIVIKAKATVIATGLFARCYNPETPLFWKYKYNYHWCPATVSGDGWAMAYRAGAELVNMEQGGRGIKFRDDLVMSYGNIRGDGIQAKVLTWDGEEDRTMQYTELEQEARDPFYYSLEHLPDDYHKRIEVAYADERLLSFKIAEDRGFNPRTHRYEMQDNRPSELMTLPGINTDSDYKTNMKGLYAIGDCVAGNHNVAAAAVSGFLVGDFINKSVIEALEPVVNEAQVQSQKQTALAPLTVKDGTEPTELECAIRYICDRYVGVSKSEGKLREGQRRLGTLRRVFLPKLIAKNPHYLMRCMEVRNIMDLTELHIQASLERNETRSLHIRLDYPVSNPAQDGLLLHQRMEEGKAVFEMRKVKPLNTEAREEE